MDAEDGTGLLVGIGHEVQRAATGHVGVLATYLRSIALQEVVVVSDRGCVGSVDLVGCTACSGGIDGAGAHLSRSGNSVFTVTNGERAIVFTLVNSVDGVSNGHARRSASDGNLLRLGVGASGRSKRGSCESNLNVIHRDGIGS